MNSDQLTNILTIILFIMLGILSVLVIIYIVLRLSDKKRKNKQIQQEQTVDNENIEETSGEVKSTGEYTKKSIYSFMKFDAIQDNMIISDNGKRFVMVVECQGVNYDLMSAVEKASTEQGFLQFLNMLRYPIQIYVQTRTVNLGNSIMAYRDKLRQIENRLARREMDFNSMVNSGQYSQEEIQKERMAVIRDRNLYEYGKDIIINTERMSLNKNILRKHYYVIISTTPEEANNPNFGKEELRDLAFNELYTKCQSIIGSLAVCDVHGKILDSVELAELLYVAYNRDESETYGMERALNARYDELYSTAQDVLDRKMKALDEKIEEEAIKKANEVLLNVAEESKKEREVKKKEENLNDLISQMAKMIIDQNEDFVGTEMADKAKSKIDEEGKERRSKNGKKETTSRRNSTTA
ncbi:MAG: hypothetical protein IKF17_03590 [Clostridia bacterium]|nr:hypothetical protein [Clostridia bacterium]